MFMVTNIQVLIGVHLAVFSTYFSVDLRKLFKIMCVLVNSQSLYIREKTNMGEIRISLFGLFREYFLELCYLDVLFQIIVMFRAD